MPYIITLIILSAAYGAGIYLMKYIRSYRKLNLILPLIVYILYVSLCIKVYFDVGFDDWNFRNTLPVANVSPFMFSLMPVLFILPKRFRGYVYLLISLLSVGMLFSAVYNCLYNAAIGYKFHHHFLLDYLAHLFLSLFGIYLVRSGQTVPRVKRSLVSASLIFAAATLMLLLNLIFDTAFFGLSLNGKHNIYNAVLVSSSYLSALLYYLGLGAVLLMGFGFSRLFAGEKMRICESVQKA